MTLHDILMWVAIILDVILMYGLSESKHITTKTVVAYILLHIVVAFWYISL